jgi:hypothetical protein
MDLTCPASGLILHNLRWKDPKGPPPPTLLLSPAAVTLRWTPNGSPATVLSSTTLADSWIVAGSSSTGQLMIPAGPASSVRQFFMVDQGQAAAAATPW